MSGLGVGGSGVAGKRDRVTGEAAEEEPSIQDLLLDQPETQSHVISGVEAWEMELGETVKLIGSSAVAWGAGGDITTASPISGVGGSKTRTRPRKREMMTGEIGRESGRKNGRNEVDHGLEGGTRKLVNIGVLDPGLFEAPPEQVGAEEGSSVDHRNGSLKASANPSTPTSALSTSTSTSESAESAFDEREFSIAKREFLIVGLESSLNIRESSIAERESVIAGLESSLDVRESSVAKHESVITGQESIIAERESSIAERESTIAARESGADKAEEEIQKRMIDVQKRELDVEKRESEVRKWEQEVSEREVKVEKREEEVKEWHEGKLAEIQRALEVPPNSASTPASTSSPKMTATSKWPASPMEFARRLCATFILPVLGEERMSGFLLESSRVDENTSSTSSTSAPPASSTTTPPTTSLIPSWSINRDLFLNQVLGAAKGGASYLLLMSIGICVVVLRGVIRRILRFGGFGRR